MLIKEKLKTSNLPKVPKRPPGPFFRYLVEQRPLLVKKHPEWTVIDITKHCTVKWKNVAADIKAKYQKQYDREFAVFEEKNKRYLLSLTPEQSKAMIAAKKEKQKSLNQSKAPKQPPSPFVRYMVEQRPLLVKKHPEWTVPDIAKHCARKWKNVTAGVKAKYQEQYDKDLVIFEEMNKQYQASLTQQSKAMILAKNEKSKGSDKKKIKKLHRDTNKPKRYKGGCIFYILTQWSLPENKDKTLMQMLASGKAEWHSMSDETRIKYLKTHRDAIERYNKEMIQWKTKIIKQGTIDLIRKESRSFAAANKASKASHTETPKVKKRC